MGRNVSLFCMTWFVCQTIIAVPTAIIDSGMDLTHPMFVDFLLESRDDADGIDTDKNGYVDDTFGWNFFENTRVQADLSVLPAAFDDYARALDLLMHLSAKTQVSAEDMTWLRGKWLGADARTFKARVNMTAAYSHGTHVGGITLRHSDETAELISLQIMPTQDFNKDIPKPPKAPTADGNDADANVADANTQWNTWTDEQLVVAFQTWARDANRSWLREVGMLGNRGIRVANCSFGFGYKMALKVIARLCRDIKIKCDDKRTHKLSKLFLYHYKRPDSRRLISTDPNIFFVVAAGNDGINNDEYPDEPGNYLTDNRIVIAALKDKGVGLAKFSNFGPKTVDVAAPGVLIESAYPNFNRGVMNGTSQATPIVTGTASAMLDRNDHLKAKDLKEILIGTVDKKSWLTDKITSGGVLNKQRALKAAELALTMTVAEAILHARVEVGDVPEHFSLIAKIPFPGRGTNPGLATRMRVGATSGSTIAMPSLVQSAEEEMISFAKSLIVGGRPSF